MLGSIEIIKKKDVCCIFMIDGFRGIVYGAIADRLERSNSNIPVDVYLSMGLDEQRRYMERLSGRKRRVISVSDQTLSQGDVEGMVDDALR